VRRRRTTCSCSKRRDRCGFRDWLDELGLHTQITIKTSALAYPHGRVLYSLLRRRLADKPEPFTTVVETGTARGFSTICLAKAMADAGAAGHVITLDVLPPSTPHLLELH
jgi:predicted O-methyltransferase YrrM